MKLWCIVLSSVVLLVLPTLASAQAAADEVAPETAPSEATVTVTTTTTDVVAVPPPPVVEAPPPPSAYAAPAPAPVAYAPPPARDPATRPSFGTSIALHVTAAIAGPLGIAALVYSLIGAIICSSGSGGACDAVAALAITGGILETASIALGISATAVHSHTRARLHAWEMGTARLMPWGGATGGGAALAFTF